MTTRQIIRTRIPPPDWGLYSKPKKYFTCLRKGLKRLLDEIISGQVGRLVITHKDRLLRFGAELVFAICETKNVEVIILNQGEDTSFEEDLAKDVLEIITVFSARLYGSRSHKNQKLINGVKQAVVEAQNADLA